MSAWVDSVGDIDDIDGYEHTGQNDLNIEVVFDFCSIEQVEPDVAKIQRVPENELDFARARHPFCSDGTISGNIVSKLSVEACDHRQSRGK